MLWVTGDLHGGETSWHVSASRFNGDAGDIVLCAGDLGGVWYHDYRMNRKHKAQEDFFLEKTLRPKFLWLAVDGNHENFARLFGGEFPLVDLFGGKAYKVRDHVFYLKRGEVFSIGGKTILALGGATSHDKKSAFQENLYGKLGRWPGRTEGFDWWPEEVPSSTDMENARRNLDRFGWKVDYVLSHTCPVSQRLLFGGQGRAEDPTEVMLQDLLDDGLEFKRWHFGHYHKEQQVDRFVCHFDAVRELEPCWGEKEKFCSVQSKVGRDLAGVAQFGRAPDL